MSIFALLNIVFSAFLCASFIHISFAFTESVDALDKDYKEFKKSSKEFQEATEEKLNDIDRRIEALEK